MPFHQMENSGVVHMLKCMKTEDLHCMYKLLGRVTDGHKTMANCVSAHLREEGKALVTDDENGANALNFVQVRIIPDGNHSITSHFLPFSVPFRVSST